LFGTAASALATSAALIEQNTHLVTPKGFNERDFHKTAALAIACYDNFFLRVKPGTTANVTSTATSCLNIPEDVRQRAVALNASVDHYAELDQRGFVQGDYLATQQDFVRQLTGDRSHLINIRGALYGGRLISDHLPVTLSLTID
jgi:hypothetical protein